MKTFKHTLEPSGEVLNLPLFEIDDPADLYKPHREEEVYEAIIEGLDKMLASDLDRYPCFAVNEYVFELNRDSALDNLNRCQAYYESIEDYETCSRLQKMKDLL